MAEEKDKAKKKKSQSLENKVREEVLRSTEILSVYTHNSIFCLQADKDSTQKILRFLWVITIPLEFRLQSEIVFFYSEVYPEHVLG